MNIVVGGYYKHYKNTCYLYKLVNECTVQIDGVWQPAIIYKREYDDVETLYVRTKEEFMKKFDKIEVGHHIPSTK